MAELESQLVEVTEGIYTVKSQSSSREQAHYLFGTELACIFTQSGKGRRIHMLVFAPNLEIAKKINEALVKRGINLKSDGRPILGLSIIDLTELLFAISEDIVLIPAHIWTPWFGMLGSKSGFESLRECCGKYAENIYAIETGLSSDPAMNWRLGEFDRRSIVSFSDAHSPDKLGRELTVFSSKKSLETTFTYQNFKLALQNKGDWGISHTIEFYPEEGKYHVDGHTKCGVWQVPAVTIHKGKTCPVCGRPLTLGVLGRVEQLATRQVSLTKKTDAFGVVLTSPQDTFHKPYLMLVPLREIIAQTLQKGVTSKGVGGEYDRLIEHLGSELKILTDVSENELRKHNEKLAEGIMKVRSGQISIKPGYDGQFGEVTIWGSHNQSRSNGDRQMTLF